MKAEKQNCIRFFGRGVGRLGLKPYALMGEDMEELVDGSAPIYGLEHIKKYLCAPPEHPAYKKHSEMERRRGHETK